MSRNRRYQDFKKRIKGRRSSMRGKIILSFGALAVVLLVSSTISIFEYRRVSSSMTDFISASIKCIEHMRELYSMSEDYNEKVFEAIGEDGISREMMPKFNEREFLNRCDSITAIFHISTADQLVDSVKLRLHDFLSFYPSEEETYDSYSAMEWYKTKLEPAYVRLRSSISDILQEAYIQLEANSQTNSQTSEDNFYRTIIPGMVASAVGLLLVLLLLFYLMTYYVNPIYRMLKNLKSSILSGTRYQCDFEGNDQLAELNESIHEVVDENVDVRRRIRIVSEENENLKDAVRSAEE